MAAVTLNGVRKNYGNMVVIDSLDLAIDDREFVVFVGPSGCGKSTLLRMIAGLEKITAGDLKIDGVIANDIPPHARGLAMVFQSYALYPHMTVADNMAFALELAGVPKAERRTKVAKTAEVLQLEKLLDRRPRELSGGQRQRVAIGRAIVRQPKVFLFDEPLSNLDAELRVQMRLEIARLHQELQATMIYVTHDQTEAMTLADRIVVLRAGTIEQVGTPLELYHHPANSFVAGFIGAPKMNFIPATVKAVSDEGVTAMLSSGGDIIVPVEAPADLVGARVTVGIRPESCALSIDGATEGRVAIIEHLGGDTLIYVDVGSNLIVTVKVSKTPNVKAGSRVRFKMSGEHACLFDEDGIAMRHNRHYSLSQQEMGRS